MPIRHKWQVGDDIPSATAFETMGLPHFEQRGSRSGCSIACTQSWQMGMRLPVSSMRVQIRQGAGNTSDASAAHISRTWKRTNSPAPVTVRQD
jgi:hypothetical protein